MTTPLKLPPPSDSAHDSKHGSRSRSAFYRADPRASLYTRNTYSVLFIRESRYIHPPHGGLAILHVSTVWTLPKRLSKKKRNALIRGESIWVLPFEITRYLLTLLKNVRIEIYSMGLVERIYNILIFWCLRCIFWDINVTWSSLNSIAYFFLHIPL